MATYFFAWELGAGLGHITVIAPLAKELAERGHRVYVALRDLSAAEMTFRGTSVALLQAPIKLSACDTPIRQPATFAHILHNCGFDSADELRGLTRAWQALYDLTRPDVIVADHAPIALLAARGGAARTAPMGISFGIPRGDRPLPNWRPGLKLLAQQLAEEEAQVVRVANAVLASWGGPPMKCIGDLYRDTNDALIGSIPELDAFGPRELEKYSGVWGPGLGERPQWPEVGRKRVFAYLKASSRIKPLLQLLARGNVATLVYMRDDLRPYEAFASNRLKFVQQPLDIADVGRTCDGTISHATHGIACAMLLAGVPQMLFPLMLEQRLTAERVVQLGAGLAARLSDTGIIARKLDAVLRDPRFRTAAQEVAARRADLSGPACLEKSVARLERLGAKET